VGFAAEPLFRSLAGSRRGCANPEVNMNDLIRVLLVSLMLVLTILLVVVACLRM
jgi:hypothetical protein